MIRTIVVTEKEWNTIYTALQIELARNSDVDADKEQQKVQADLQAALEAVRHATVSGA